MLSQYVAMRLPVHDCHELHYVNVAIQKQKNLHLTDICESHGFGCYCLCLLYGGLIYKVNDLLDENICPLLGVVRIERLVSVNGYSYLVF